jgi:hypothetical protein
MKVGENKDSIDTTNVHSENFYSKPSVVKHLLTKFDNESGLGNVVSTEEETGEQL